MDHPTVRTWIVPWLDISDALAIRAVSREWWREPALSLADDRVWERLVDATHGPAVAGALRAAFPALRGWRLVRRIHREGGRDDREVSALALDDVTCMIEFSWRGDDDEGRGARAEGGDDGRRPRAKRRKMHLASFMVEKLWEDARDWHHHTQLTGLPSISVPNPDRFNTGQSAYDQVARKLEIRATFFRRDTQQRCSLILEHFGGGFPSRIRRPCHRNRFEFERTFQESMLRRPKYAIELDAYLSWTHLRSKDGNSAVLNLDKFSLSILRGDIIHIEEGEGEEFKSEGELLVALEKFPWS